MSTWVMESARLDFHQLSAESPGDAAFMHRLLNEPSFIANIGDRNVRTLDEARAYLTMGPVASYQANGFGLYRLQLKHDGATVGLCGLVKRPTLQDVDLGYALLPEFCGQGLAVEAAEKILTNARTELGLQRIVAIVNPSNTSSIRVLEKLDFRFEEMRQLSSHDIPVKLFASVAPR